MVPKLTLSVDYLAGKDKSNVIYTKKPIAFSGATGFVVKIK